MKYFANIQNLADLKSLYKALAMANHPDRGGDVEIMKAINVQYEAAFKALQNGTQSASEAEAEWEAEAVYMEKIQALANFEGLEIELCGTWIWVTGNTRPAKEALKQAGFFWANKKLAWFWRPEDSKTSNRTERSLHDIRGLHGSKKMTPARTAAIG